MNTIAGVSSAPQHREIELDFIRGIAILMVIDFHSPGNSVLLAPFVMLGYRNFGWAGVDIFFVLSGFLVGGLLVKEWKVFGGISVKRFLVRRGFKIWPQYYVFIFLGILSGHRKLSDQWGNLLNLQNYIGGIAHTWSLAVEEHAYLLLVAILAVAARRNIRMRRLFWFVAFLAAAVVANSMIESYFAVDSYTHTDTRLNGILFGVLLAIIYHYVPDRFARLQKMWLLWASVIAGTLLSLRVMPQTSPWTAPISIFLADLSGVALLFLLYRRGVNDRYSLPYRSVAAIGVYSYGIYLWHVSVIAVVVNLARRMPHFSASIWMVVGPYLLGILIGIFFTKSVEFPMLALRDRLFPRRVDSAVGIPAGIEAASGITGEAESVSCAS